ncbi:MAG: hypothetical protein IKM84_07015, partial [Oscillospiraceae bacterium]|nr:hypothetical protein [Oscillospiraceae bacterium]
HEISNDQSQITRNEVNRALEAENNQSPTFLFDGHSADAFSLFRHPPRGGAADATFPRWGTEIAAANSPGMA